MKSLKYLPLAEKKAGGIGHVIGQTLYQPQQAFTYYAGSAWSRYDVPTMQVWRTLLEGYAQQLRQPLTVE